MVAVSFLREFGIEISVYLDDRLIRDQPGRKGRNAILALMIITAAGGVLSLKKSDTEGEIKSALKGEKIT